MGTDCGVGVHGTNLEELGHLAAALGMPPAQVWAAASGVAAELLRAVGSGLVLVGHRCLKNLEDGRGVPVLADTTTLGAETPEPTDGHGGPDQVAGTLIRQVKMALDRFHSHERVADQRSVRAAVTSIGLLADRVLASLADRVLGIASTEELQEVRRWLGDFLDLPSASRPR